MRENEKYLLKDSGPIGLALMVVISDAFPQPHEHNAIQTTQFNPILPGNIIIYKVQPHQKTDEAI